MVAVDVNLISTSGRIRGLDDAHVQALLDSIAEVGLLNPVSVYRKPITRAGEPVDGYGLIAGAHRLEACKRLGLADIEATIVDLDEPHRVLAECDENLCGTRLTAAERAEFTSRRKWAYEQLHPETAHGGDKPSRQVGDFESSSDVKRFTSDTAVKTGQSERKVQRDAERGSKVCNSALAMVKGTHLDKGTYLDKLKDLPSAAQIRRVQADLAAPRPVRTQAPADDDDVTERQVAALMAAWNRAGREARDAFLSTIGHSLVGAS